MTVDVAKSRNCQSHTGALVASASLNLGARRGASPPPGGRGAWGLADCRPGRARVSRFLCTSPRGVAARMLIFVNSRARRDAPERNPSAYPRACARLCGLSRGLFAVLLTASGVRKTLVKDTPG